MELELTFNLDRLPVAFGTMLPMKDGNPDRKPLGNAMKEFADLIWKIGGFRFRHRKTHWDKMKFIYYCCQDADRADASVTQRKRDTPRMERFKCQSKLTLKPSLEQRTLGINMYHHHHIPYFDCQFSSEVMQFLLDRTATKTPAEIYQDLQGSKPPGWEHARPSQVYYQWKNSNLCIWRRDPDPFCSTQILLSERSDIRSSTYRVDNVRGLAFYISDSITMLGPHAKELAMDATFGTNNAGIDLFAVLAEVDGTGVPLAYCFVEIVENNNKGERRAIPGAISGILCQFLQHLRALGLDPTFFGTDKDTSEIFAVRQIWPNTVIQLCYWHARRAIRTKLASSKKTNTQNEYKPSEAQSVIPDLEVCWGSMPIRRPDGQHRYGGCSCPSRPDFADFPTLGRMEPKDSLENKTVLNVFSNHFNSHPFVPDQNGTCRSAQQIHRDCAREMYSWCRSRNYFRLWAYLWVNWYQPSQWVLWARSTNATEIPVLKTTMIVESHWRKLKHDYLHKFNRPRIDLVVWVLLTRAIPDSLVRMRALLSQDHRRAIASWRKAFKREWKKLTIRSEVIEDPIQRYHTNPAQWTCACPIFINSRFLICKHLLFFYEPILDPVRFFREVKRQRFPPFWIEKGLTLRPEYRPTAEVQDCLPDEDTRISHDSDEDPNSGIDEDPSCSDTEEDFDPEAANEDQLVSDSEEDISLVPNNNQLAVESDSDDNEIDEIASFIADSEKFVELLRDQRAKGNRRFLRKAMETPGRGVQSFVREVSSLGRQNSMPQTWKQRKYAASIYFEPGPPPEDQTP